MKKIRVLQTTIYNGRVYQTGDIIETNNLDSTILYLLSRDKKYEVLESSDNNESDVKKTNNRRYERPKR